MPPRTSYARARDGVSIAYQVIGEGERALVLVPQTFSAVEALWEHPTVARFFERLANLGRTVLYDRRGTGMSDRTGRPAPLEEHADDLHAVMDAAGVERADLMAIMEGGPMAMVYAASAPERVRSLVLFATFARTVAGGDYPAGWDEEERASSMRAMVEHWGDGSIFARFAPAHGDDPTMREWLGRVQRMALGPGEAAAAVELNAQLDVRHVLGSIRVPTLVLHRTDDQGIDVRHSRYIAEHIPGAKLVELPGVDHPFFVGDADAVIDEIEAFVTGNRPLPKVDRVLASVLFVDIVGSTQQAVALGDSGWRDRLEAYLAMARRQLDRFAGQEIDTAGDGLFASFDGPARAVTCAIAIREAAGRMGIEVRAGLHVGECELIAGKIGGVTVHVAARVAALAEPGEVLVSRTIKDLVAGSGIRFEERGSHALKGLPDTWSLYRAEV